MQTRIDNILCDATRTHDEKILALRKLFMECGIRVFSDFDDTIGRPGLVLAGLSKMALALAKLGRADPYTAMDRLIGAFFRPNPDFAALVAREHVRGPIVILTRNEHAFIRRFAEYARTRPDAVADLEIAGVVGRISGVFSYESVEKLDLLTPDGILIADGFEHADVRDSDRMRRVDRRSDLATAALRLVKIVLLAASIPRLLATVLWDGRQDPPRR